jgi:RNA polymerase sigma factor (sigma-70 family)
MRENATITQEAFDSLLGWLDKNRDAAGQKYEKIRRRLIRVFSGRGCFEAELLADETINRVTIALPRIIRTYTGEPILYFFGVANNVHHEWLRKQTKTVEIQPEIAGPGEVDRSEAEFQCLDNCLRELPDGQRDLIIEYYKKEKSAKILHRQKLAKSMGIAPNALQIRASRIRARLRECVGKCVETGEGKVSAN